MVRISKPMLAAVAAGVVALSTLALAHTKLEKSEPAAGATLTEKPKQIRLWFNETIDQAVSKLELTGASGKVALSGTHVMNGKELMASVTGSVPSGAYTVAWQTAGDDGHVVKGTFTFTVKATTH
jgi:hypothetical protein